MKIFVKRGKGIKKEGFIRKGGMYDFFFFFFNSLSKKPRHGG